MNIITMFRAFSIAILFGWCSLLCTAQCTNATVTGTIVDPTGQAYAYGTVTANFIVGPNTGPYTCNGTTFPNSVTGTMDSSGLFSITLPMNTHIQPSGSRWNLTVFPLASSRSTSVTFIISTTPQDTSAGINAAVPATIVTAMPIPYSYSEAQVKNSNPGVTTFWNITNAYPEWWNPVTASWVTGGSGGGSSVYVNTNLIGSPNFNGTTPSPDSGFLNGTFKVNASNIVLEMPYGSNASTFALGNAPISQFTGNATVAQITNALTTPPPIGAVTPNTVKATTLQSTVSTGTPPLSVASTTQVSNLNVSELEGDTFEAPGTIGSTTPNTIAATTISSTGSANLGTSMAAHGSIGANGAVPAGVGTNGLPTCASGLSGWWADSTSGMLDFCSNGVVIPANNITLLTNGNGTIASAGPTSSFAGTGSWVNLYTYTIPGGTLTTVGGIQVNCGIYYTSGISPIQFRITGGGTTLGILQYSNSGIKGYLTTTLYNNGATNAQYYNANGYSGAGGTYNNIGLTSGTSAIDTTSNYVINCDVNSTSTPISAYVGVIFEVIRKAQ